MSNPDLTCSACGKPMRKLPRVRAWVHVDTGLIPCGAGSIAERRAELIADLDALVARGLLRKLPDGRYDLPEEFKTEAGAPT